MTVSETRTSNSAWTDFGYYISGYVFASLAYLCAHFTSAVGLALAASVPIIFCSLLVPHEPAVVAWLSARSRELWAFGFGCLTLVALQLISQG